MAWKGKRMINWIGPLGNLWLWGTKHQKKNVFELLYLLFRYTLSIHVLFHLSVIPHPLSMHPSFYPPINLSVSHSSTHVSILPFTHPFVKHTKWCLPCGNFACNKGKKENKRKYEINSPESCIISLLYLLCTCWALYNFSNLGINFLNHHPYFLFYIDFHLVFAFSHSKCCILSFIKTACYQK